MPISPATAWALTVLGAATIVPGLALLRLLGIRLPDRGVAAGLAVGLGVALTPLGLLWAKALGVPVTPAARWLGLGLCALVVAWPRRGHRVDSPAGDLDSAPGQAHLVLAGLIAIALAMRWVAAADLLVPAWGDSVHHTQITALIGQQRGLPDNWLPYAPLVSFSYHFGFHALAATVTDLARLAPHTGVLVAGQGLSVLGVLTAYAMGAGLSGRPWVGVGAALAAAGLGVMPGYYVHWGRYTQLAGQVILAAAVVPTAYLALGRTGRLRWAAAGAVLVAGLALTHYVVTLFFALFVPAWFLATALVRTQPKDDRVNLSGRVAGLAGAAAGAALLASAWISRFAEGHIGRAAAALVTSPSVAPEVYGVAPAEYVWSRVGELVGWPLIGGMALGLAAAVGAGWRRVALAGAFWTTLMVTAAYPRLFGLPVVGVIKDFAVALGLYVPAGLLVGAFAGWAAARAARGLSLAAVGLGTLLLAMAGGVRDLDTSVPPTQLVTPADLAAFDWIRRESSPEAVFLVSGFEAFGGTVVAGEDAGWWLPYFTGRTGTVPPVTVGLEESGEPGYREATVELVRLWQGDLDSPGTRAALDRFGVTHAFVGATAADGGAGPGRGLAEQLGASPGWRLLHRENRAAVYARVDK